jgi:hypothetical protein
MKWIFGLVALGLLAGLVYWQRGAVKSSYVNGLPQYTLLPGREFVFERDCYVFKQQDRSTDWPLVADHALVPSLPAAVERRNLGAEFPGVHLLDVIPTGTPIRIVSVRRDESRRTGTSITFEILFLDEPTREYARVDAFYLLDHAPEKEGLAPKFLEQYVVPRMRR